MHICFLSNGYGEDRSAAAIAKALMGRCPDITISGAPLITVGGDYIKYGIPVLTEGQIPPSGGFPTMSAAGFIKDIPYTFRHIRYYKTLRAHRDCIDCVVVVGDLFLLFLAYLAFKKNIIHLSLPKSDFNHPHFKLEEWLFKKFARRVLTRDAHTAETLKLHGVDALFLGNPIMDELAPRGLKLGDSPMVGILPGSRDEAYANFARILAALERIPESACYVCALAPSLEPERMAEYVKVNGWVLESAVLKKGRNAVRLVKDGFEDIVASSDVLIGLAGTANEQAAGCGKPVVSFAGTGPQTTVKRMKDQERMLGGAVRYVKDSPADIAAEVSMLLKNPDERERRGRIGIERMGRPGASARMAEFLQKEFNIPC
ncbi:MAG: lipid-A-disaccharide synthase-related protein [Armatimonadota bacterium]